METIETKKVNFTSLDLWIEGFASALTIGTGGSAGRIGPVVEIGAGLGDLLGQKLNYSLDLYRTMLGCGAAAGIAAIFNAPLGGIMFVIEILYKRLEIKRLSLIVISSISADALVRNIMGYNTIFSIPEFFLNSPWEYLLYMVLGVLMALMGYLLVKMLILVTHFFEGLKIPFWLKPAIGGLLIGIAGYQFPQILGTGIKITNLVLNKEFNIYLLITLCILKMIMTVITLGSGGSGGIFAPTLLIGASGGILFGQLMHHILPQIVITPTSFGIVGMTALIGGVIQAPLTSVLIIFELTKNYGLMIPLLLASGISSIIFKKLSKESIYSPDLFHRL